MSYTVCIPCAGLGSRLGGLTKYIPKALVSIGTKPAISRIIESFPRLTKFVIPVGYKGDLIKEYISLAYPDLKVKFVDVLLYSGKGSGLGYTLKQCKDFLQEPFIFCSCDTITTTHIPNATQQNWIAWDERENNSSYRTISIDDAGNVKSINEKGYITDEAIHPYIGLCGIKDYKLFWKYMDEDTDDCINIGESYAIKKMLGETTFKALKFNWFDLGAQIELDATRRKFEADSDVNILPKEDEAIWLLEDKAIKFHNDYNFISNRIARSDEIKDFIPKIIAHTTHMYSSELIEGPVLSSCIDLPTFKQFLDFSKTLWVKKDLNTNDEVNAFHKDCFDFYVTKTIDRVHKFYQKFNHKDENLIINGVTYPQFCKIFESIDKEWLTEGIPSRYHGDYHFENVMYDERALKFKLLDWRQGFGSSLNTGDVYYDLAKLLHGLIISHELVHLNLFDVKWEGNEITFDFNRKQKLVDCENYYYKWLEDEGYDVKKVKVLTALIFLNIAALHHYNYCELLYALGLTMLYDAYYVTQ